MQEQDEVSKPDGDRAAPASHTSRFSERPATNDGRWAGWTALIAFLSLFISAIVNNAFESDDPGTVFEVGRLIPILVFAFGGLVALVLSVRSLMNSERSYIVWAAFIVGLFATTLMILEFTVLE